MRAAGVLKASCTIVGAAMNGRAGIDAAATLQVVDGGRDCSGVHTNAADAPLAPSTSTLFLRFAA
jgi:hypothetical protein